MVLGLPFEEVWAIDFEYVAPDGERPRPICLVARELGTNRLLRLFEHELPATPPFRTDEHVLFVAYSAHAELQCFAELGWPMPERIVDPFFEHCASINGTGGGRTLLDALSFHGIPAITSAEK